VSLPSLRTPSYRLHKPTGQAVVTLNCQDRYLGRYGTPESRAEYDRLLVLQCGPEPADLRDVHARPSVNHGGEHTFAMPDGSSRHDLAL
jgi:hypothetical protein